MRNIAMLLRQLLIISVIFLFLPNLIYATGKSTFPTGMIITANVNLHNTPNNSATVITTVSGRQTVAITGQSGLWYKIKLDNGQVGWILKTYIATEGETVKTQQNSPEKLVRFAQKYLNTVYVYGGNSPKGFDCSGFTRFVYTQFGYQIPHRSEEQINWGVPVNRENLVPADLVFFSTMNTRQINHVGIYIGNGKFIHASSGSRRVRINTLNEAYYKTRYQGARRVLLKVNSFS